MSRFSALPHGFSRRAVVFGAVQAVGLSALAARLYYLQFVKADEYKTLAEGNRVKLQLLTPSRGKLLDRNGVELATNQPNFRLLLERDNSKQARMTFEAIQKHIELPKERVAKLHETLKYRHPTPLLIKQYLTWNELATLEFHSPDLPGLRIEEGELRYYPFMEAASHLIGYVGKVSEKEQDADNQPLLRLPEFKIGKNGCEIAFEEMLRGQAGSKHLEVNALGRTQRELKREPAQSGNDLRLTIDSRLQQYAAERINEESGAVAVADIETGNMLALVSMPAYDPNSFSLGITQNYWDELMANEKNPLLNKALAGQYPPGSTFKMIVGLAGLETGEFTEYSHVHCPGHYYLGKHRFNCWKASGHGSMNLVSAIAESCDTYFYTVARKIGIEKISEVAKRFGFDVSSSLALPNEKSGIIPTPEWKRERFDQPWVGGDTINASIGQGYVLATPLQLLKMTIMMANGGKPVDLSLTVNDVAPTYSDPVADAYHMQLLQKGMHQVTNSTSGTAYWKRIKAEGYEMAGKTGTSQVRAIKKRGQKQEDLPWKQRHHGLFVGYAPAHAPRYAASVIIEHGGGGSSAAAPVARDVLAKVQELAAEDAGVPVTILEPSA